MKVLNSKKLLSFFGLLSLLCSLFQWIGLSFIGCLNLMILNAGQPNLGIFESNKDIGSVGKPGSVEYSASNESYKITGGGENMWFTNDMLHFVWKKVEGDVSLAADISWVGKGVNAHRKACLIIRQSLDPASAYIDVAVHGDGLTSLQCRDTEGGQTREIQANVIAPKRVSIEKQENQFYMLFSKDGDKLQPAGGSFKVGIKPPYYVGLGVCSHDNKVVETAVFSKVELKPRKSTSNSKPFLRSTLEIVPIASGDRRAIYCVDDRIEAPNWSPDGSYFLFNRRGRIYQLPVKGGEPQVVDTGFANRCNNDHGLSADGKWLAISDQSQAGGKSLIYVLPATGGTPKLVTPLGPSYWHGWSPDGKTLTYCAERKGEYDIYTISVDGGEEKRLTTAAGLDDGSEYSPDGQTIFFNSERTGLMQIWRMKPDGSEQQQVSFDDYNNWFAHPSPDGKWLVFLTYEKEVKGHPENQDVMLRLMPMAGGKPRVLAKLFGGQGTINVPSWSPDSKSVAFVSYLLCKPMK